MAYHSHRRRLFPLLVLIFLTFVAATAFNRTVPFHPDNNLVEVFDPFVPSDLPSLAPNCTVSVLKLDLNSSRASGIYYAPSSNCSWNVVALDFSVKRYNGSSSSPVDVVGVWLDGVEILRSSTGAVNEANASWSVQKDVTSYSSLLRWSPPPTNETAGGRVLTLATERVKEQEEAGAYNYEITISFSFYYDKSRERAGGPPTTTAEKVLDLYASPADLVIPLRSGHCADCGGESWYKVMEEWDLLSNVVAMPANAHRAVLELYVSAHADDQQWYSNPPNSYIEQSHLSTKSGNGPLRQLYAKVDNFFAGSVIPFPIVYSDGVNPLFWSPVAPLGSFDFPSYKLELTPFLGKLIMDANQHRISVGITSAIQYWLVGANVHVWLDSKSPAVKAGLATHWAPDFSSSWSSEWGLKSAKFEFEAEKEVSFSGWVYSSLGNITTFVKQELEFESELEYKENGKTKEAKTESECETEVKIQEGKYEIAKIKLKYKFPIRVNTDETTTVNNTKRVTTNITHEFYEKVSKKSKGIKNKSYIVDKQSGGGWMEVDAQGNVVTGSAATDQTYSRTVDKSCYVRTIAARDGVILSDFNTTVCAPDQKLGLRSVLRSNGRKEFDEE